MQQRVLESWRQTRAWSYGHEIHLSYDPVKHRTSDGIFTLMHHDAEELWISAERRSGKWWGLFPTFGGYKLYILSSHATIGSSIQPGVYEHRRFSVTQLYLARKEKSKTSKPKMILLDRPLCFKTDIWDVKLLFTERSSDSLLVQLLIKRFPWKKTHR